MVIRYPTSEIAACILFLWMFVFIGGSLKVISLPDDYGSHAFLWTMVYGIVAVLCMYAAVLLIKRKKMGLMLAHLIFLSVLTSAWVGVVPSLLVLPTVVLGGFGVILLCLDQISGVYARSQRG